MSAASYITDTESLELHLSDLPTAAPFVIPNVSHSQFSISRYYGGCKLGGMHYTYMQPADELVRDDVLHWLKRHRKAIAKAA